MGIRRIGGLRIALILLALVLGVAAPVHVLAAHGGADTADHMHATCGVCFTLFGAASAGVVVTASVAGDDRPAVLPVDDETGSPASPHFSDPTRGPPFLLA